MYVIKRDGRHETVHFDKITARLKKLAYGLNTDFCDPVQVAQKVRGSPALLPSPHAPRRALSPATDTDPLCLKALYCNTGGPAGAKCRAVNSPC